MTEREKYAPIVVFGYKRVDKISNCLDALDKCTGAAESDLFIFADGPKGEKDSEDVRKVHEYLRKRAKQGGFHHIELVCQEKNKGLAESIMMGVTQVVNKYGKVIVVEDDLIVNDDFLLFLNDGLDYYEDDKRYGSISAYSYPMKCLGEYNKDVFATRKAECWGWATWSDRWEDAKWREVDYKAYFSKFRNRVQFESLEAGLDRLMCLQRRGKVDSWAVRWVYHLFLNEMYTIYPKQSHVANDGFDGSGTHCGNTSGINGEAHGSEKYSCAFETLDVDEKLAQAYARHPRGNRLRYYYELLRFYIFRR